MVSGSWACTSMTKPKSVGRLPLTSRPVVAGVVGAHHVPVLLHEEHAGALGMHGDVVDAMANLGRRDPVCIGTADPRLIGFQVAPPSSVRKAPAAEMAMHMRCGLLGSRMMVCRHMPPAPGCHLGPVPWPRRPGSSAQFWPPSVERKMAASSTPAYTVSGSVSDGSRCQTRLNSQGCCVPSYHWWVSAV